MPESEKRTYESLSKELAICYMKSGIAATAIPLLGIYEQRAEQHLAQIDDERKDALQRLSKVEAENKNNAVLIAKLRERLTTGATGRISEEILTTLGADGRTAAYCESRDKAVTKQNVREFAEFLEHCGGFTID